MSSRNIILTALWFLILYVAFSWTLSYQQKLLLWPNNNIQIEERDTDIWLRLTQVKQWINNPDFYNHTIPNTNAPIGGMTTPWTRPMDALLLSGYHLTSNTMPTEQRLMLSATWTPVLLGLLSFLLLLKTSGRSFKNIEATTILALCFFANKFVYFHFFPGNADHHNLQTFLWCGILYLLYDRKNFTNALFLGIAIGLSIWVSVEALILAIPLYAFLCLQNINRRETFVYPLASTISVLITTAIGLMIELPFSELFTNIKYDTLSIAHVTAIGLGALGIAALQYLKPKIKHSQNGVIALAIIAPVMTITLYSLFPDIYQGPFAGLDKTYLIEIFFPSIPEAMPLLTNSIEIIYLILMFPLITAFLSIFFIRKNPLIWVLFYVTVAMTLAQMRWFYYLEPISILLIAKYLPVLLRHYRMTKLRKIRFIAQSYLVIIVALLLSNNLPAFVTDNHKSSVRSSAPCEANIFYNIQSGQLVDKIGDKPVTIESNMKQPGGPILFFTPYKIITAHYHREIEAEKQWNNIFSSTNAEDVKSILKDRKIDYLVVCTDETSWLRNYANGVKNPTPTKWIENLGSLNTPPNNPKLAEHNPILLKINLNE